MRTDLQIPHRIKKRLGGGVNEVTHPMDPYGNPACPCFLFIHPPKALFIRYNIASGNLDCFRCGTTLFLPCPSVRTSFASREVYMDPEAIARDLATFANKHRDCPPTETWPDVEYRDIPVPERSTS